VNDRAILRLFLLLTPPMSIDSSVA